MRGRFAPSPTGEMHLGNAWTALWAWLQVRSYNGTMVLRIEDLDPDRSKDVYTAGLIRDLGWLGLDWDEGPDVHGPYFPYNQAARRDIYQQALERLKEMGLIYPCYCTRAEIHNSVAAPNGGESGPNYPGTCRNLTRAECRHKENLGRRPAWRVRVPKRTLVWQDFCQGDVSASLLEAGDFVVQRADGVHAYQLAVVVDDGMMNMTHVLRGDDLLQSTPRQLWLYQVLGLTAPQFAHVPLLYGADGHRLSKRHGDLSIAALRRQGVRAEAIVGYLAYQAGLIPNYEPLRARDLIPSFSLAKLPTRPVLIKTFPFS